MEVLLKRIKRSSFDEVKEAVIDNFLANNVIDIDDDMLEKNSEEILIDGAPVRINYSLDVYNELANSEEFK